MGVRMKAKDIADESDTIKIIATQEQEVLGCMSKHQKGF